jgi:hypothetical protein
VFRGTSFIEKENCLDSVNLLTALARVPIFYTCAGRRIRLAFCVSRYKLDKRLKSVLSRYTLLLVARVAEYSDFLRIIVNGSVV